MSKNVDCTIRVSRNRHRFISIKFSHSFLKKIKPSLILEADEIEGKALNRSFRRSKIREKNASQRLRLIEATTLFSILSGITSIFRAEWTSEDFRRIRFGKERRRRRSTSRHTRGWSRRRRKGRIRVCDRRVCVVEAKSAVEAIQRS